MRPPVVLQSFGEKCELRRGSSAIQPFQNDEASKYTRFHRAQIVMRTGCLVIAILLFSVVLGFPQEKKTSGPGPSCSLNRTITVWSNDETAVPVMLIGPTSILDPGLQMPTATALILVRSSRKEQAAPGGGWRARNSALENLMLPSDFQSTLSESLPRAGQFERRKCGSGVLVPRTMRLEIIKSSGYTDNDAGVEAVLRTFLFSQVGGRKDEVSTVTYRFRLEKQD